MKEFYRETPFGKIRWDDENEILWVEAGAGIETVEQAQFMTRAEEEAQKILHKEKLRVIVDLSETVLGYPKTVRDYFASDRVSKVERATALIVKTPISRVLGNFFIGFSHPSVPVKLFTDPKEAIAWLKTFCSD